MAESTLPAGVGNARWSGIRRFDSRLGFDVRRVKVQQAIAEYGPGVTMTLRTFPPMPGSVVRHRIINALGIRQADLANAMGVSKVRISQILNGHAPITPEMALRLGNVTRTAPEYWLSLQREFDLFHARHRLADQLDRLPRLVSEQDAKVSDE